VEGAGGAGRGRKLRKLRLVRISTFVEFWAQNYNKVLKGAKKGRKFAGWKPDIPRGLRDTHGANYAPQTKKPA